MKKPLAKWKQRWIAQVEAMSNIQLLSYAIEHCGSHSITSNDGLTWEHDTAYDELERRLAKWLDGGVA